MKIISAFAIFILAFSGASAADSLPQATHLAGQEEYGRLGFKLVFTKPPDYHQPPQHCEERRDSNGEVFTICWRWYQLLK